MQLQVEIKNNQVTAGTAAPVKVKVPALDKEVELSVNYSTAKGVEGSGKIDYNYHGLTGNMTVKYLNGSFSGDVTLGIQRAKYNGQLALHMAEDGTLSGSGTVTAILARDLEATGGLIVDKSGAVRLNGKLTRTKPYTLFAQRSDARNLFKLPKLKFPVPGLSLPVVGGGLYLEVGAGIDSAYSLGPALIDNLIGTGNINPLRPDDNPSWQLTASLKIPASASLSVWASADLVIDLAVIKGAAGLKITATALLTGGVGAEARIAYESGVLKAEIEAKIAAALILLLKVAFTARVTSPFKDDPLLDKNWPIAGFKYDTGLNFGMTAGMKYDSVAGLQPPTVSFDKISFDPEDATRKSLASKAGK